MGGKIKDKSDKVGPGRFSLDELPDEHALCKWYNAAVGEQDEVKKWEADRQQKKTPDPEQNTEVE